MLQVGLQRKRRGREPVLNNGNGHGRGEWPTGSLRCPRCGSDAVYRYGKTPSGWPRVICQVCGRQFSVAHPLADSSERPLCPACGKRMHVYMRTPKLVRFRCADYPACRVFIKIETKKEDSTAHDLRP